MAKNMNQAFKDGKKLRVVLRYLELTKIGLLFKRMQWQKNIPLLFGATKKDVSAYGTRNRWVSKPTALMSRSWLVCAACGISKCFGVCACARAKVPRAVCD